MTKKTFWDLFKSEDQSEDEPEDDTASSDAYITEARGEVFLEEARGQVGTRFEMGAETSVREDDPDAFDSSELVQWAAGRAGVTIRDGSWRQYQQLYGKGSTVDVDTALDTPGALVFRFPEDVSDDPTTWEGRPPGSHVAISLGDGTVLEATTGGVRIVEHGGRFTHGGSIPEITGTIEPLPESDEMDSAEDETESSEDETLVDAIEEDAATDADSTDDADDPTDSDSVDDTDDPTDSDSVDKEWAEKALDLRKQALDKSQEAEAALSELQDARARRATLQESGDDATDVVLRLNSEDPQGEAWSERLAEAEVVKDKVLEQIERFDKGLAVLKEDATSLADDAQALRVQAADTVTAALPGTGVKGSEDDFVEFKEPGTLSGPVSPERLREWLADRNESAHQREEFAGRSLNEAEIDEDLADSYFEIAGEARGRAAAERIGIEADQAQLDRLAVRKAEAEAFERRLNDEVQQESAQADRLSELGNTADAAAASERVTVIMQRQFQWSGQVSSLSERMETTQTEIDQATEDAAEYDQLATEFEDLAERHQGLADIGESLGTEIHDEIDRDDFVTDKVEDAFAHPEGQDRDFNFDLIDGRSGNDLHIELDRDAAPESTGSAAVEADASVTPEIEDVPLAEATSDAPLGGTDAQAIIDETLDPDQPDLGLESDVIPETPDPVEFAVLDEQPSESDFEDRLDVAEEIEDSFDDVLDDQA